MEDLLYSDNCTGDAAIEISEHMTDGAGNLFQYVK